MLPAGSPAALLPREVALRTLRRQPAGRLPLTLDVGASAGIDSSYLEIFRRHTGAEDPAEYFDYDIRFVKAPLAPAAADYARYYEQIPAGTTFDELGVGHVPAADFPLGQDLHPWKSFTSPRQVEEYPLPIFRLEAQTVEAIHALKGRGYAVSVAAGSINEWCYALRGMDSFLTDLALEPRMAEAALARVAELCALLGRELAGAGADILCFYGDMGAQGGLLLGPEMWARFIQPLWRQILAAARRASPEALFFYHSCGYIEPIIPGLIEAGFQVLNPVQPESMDPVRIKRLFGQQIALWGGIGMQSTMLRASAQEVRAATRALLRAWARGGGAIVTAAQTMLADVPWENVLALVETVRDFRPPA
jgi:uroporphyrinogen decarboxylase